MFVGVASRPLFLGMVKGACAPGPGAQSRLLSADSAEEDAEPEARRPACARSYFAEASVALALGPLAALCVGCVFPKALAILFSQASLLLASAGDLSRVVSITYLFSVFRVQSNEVPSLVFAVRSQKARHGRLAALFSRATRF